MTGIPAYDRSTYLEDVKALKRRGMSTTAIASTLGMSRATVYRILKGQ